MEYVPKGLYLQSSLSYVQKRSQWGCAIYIVTTVSIRRRTHTPNKVFFLPIMYSWDFFCEPKFSLSSFWISGLVILPKKRKLSVTQYNCTVTKLLLYVLHAISLQNDLLKVFVDARNIFQTSFQHKSKHFEHKIFFP